MVWLIVGLVIVVAVVVIVALVLGGESSTTRRGGQVPPIEVSLPPPPAPPVTQATTLARPLTDQAFLRAREDIRTRRAELDAALLRFDSTGFDALTALHFGAFQTADIAYKLYRSTRASSLEVSKTIEQLDGYLAKLGQGIARSDKRYIASRDSSRATRRELVSNAQALQTQTAGLLAGVQGLNATTHTLKMRIRDEGGQRGRDWYARLEARNRRI